MDICSPIRQRHVIPLVRQSIDIPFPERAVVLDHYLLQFFRRHTGRQYDARHLFPSECLHGGKPHVTSENYVPATVRIDYGPPCLKQFGSLHNALLESFHLVFRPLTGIGRHAGNLSGIHLKIRQLDFSRFHTFDFLQSYKNEYNIRIIFCAIHLEVFCISKIFCIFAVRLGNKVIEIKSPSRGGAGRSGRAHGKSSC